MDTKPLERFARAARQQLHVQVAAQLDAVLGADSALLRGYAAAIRNLKDELHATSRPAVIERVAYTWFNRFCALRYMDANGYTPLRIVSPADGFTLPEILQEAKAGVFDDELSCTADRKVVGDLLAGRMRSGDPQGEAYRLLLVAACNAYHATMPFMFEPIGDVTELLMPADLLSPNSVLAAARAALTVEACQDVEVIGWLYQFYIAEKKEAVDAKVKGGGKVAPDELPAKTALYTPHWIVRYLVENSLGRLWLLNRPTSRLAEQMPYYIKPEEPEQGDGSPDFLVVRSPEELTVADPACGAGHMLTYAFDLLYRIYEEEGYNPPEIPRLILEKNLWGMEIDPRSAALAAFALTMKARGRDRRFLRRGVAPHICAYTPATVTEAELRGVAWFKELSKSLVDLPIRDALLHDLGLWEQIANIGSLLQPQLTLEQIATLGDRIGGAGNLLDELVNERVLGVLEQLAYLARKYYVVVANPPYLGGDVNEPLRDFAKAYFPNSKSDLFAMFMERILSITLGGGLAGVMTPFTWMFLSSYEALRYKILDSHTLLTLVRPEYHAFFESAYVPVCAFTISVGRAADIPGTFIDLNQFYGADIQAARVLEAIGDSNCNWCFRRNAADFKRLPGAPIAYQVTKSFIDTITGCATFGSLAPVKEGLNTGDNERFLRLWHEVMWSRIGTGHADRTAARASGRKWFPCNKGGMSRKWYGNNEYAINWQNDGEELFSFSRAAMRNVEYYFREGLTWSGVSISGFTCRYFPPGFVFNSAGRSALPKRDLLWFALGLLNSKVGQYYLSIVAPTLSFTVGNVASVPVVGRTRELSTYVEHSVTEAVVIAQIDWDHYEVSWDFLGSSMLRPEFHEPLLSDAVGKVHKHNGQLCEKLQHLEEENNRIFIEAYGLQDELTPDVPLSEITLTCNPHHRYGGNKSEEELERLLKADTMREFISYAVGCMFGRYSLDKPGLILANQGETVADYLRIVGAGDSSLPMVAQNDRFLPDKDNVIPILDGDWFTDDIVARFGRFLRVTFGEAHYAENLAFIEAALGRDLRSFFVREFYDDHLKRYQRRPIYWLFSSSGGSFNALVYMHRYKPDTVSVVLNDYLREYQAKLTAARSDALHNSIAAGASNREKAAALKEVARLDKVLKELAEYETVLLELARKQVQIDLDDGVKVNYAKFGGALRRVVGLNA